MTADSGPPVERRDSPFGVPDIMDGYPLRAKERAANDRVLADLYERQPELRPRHWWNRRGR